LLPLAAIVPTDYLCSIMEVRLLPLAAIVPTDYLCSIMEARLLPLATIVPTDYLQDSQPPSSLAVIVDLVCSSDNCSIMEARLLPLATIVPTDYLQGSQPPSSLAGGSSILPGPAPSRARARLPSVAAVSRRSVGLLSANGRCHLM